MADIDIQEKERSVWPWIVGLLGLVLVVWVAAEMLGDDEPDFAVTDPAAEETLYPAAVPTDATDAGMPMAVTQFEQECASPGTTADEMSLDHSYVEGCIRQMTAAMDAVIERDTVNDQALSEQMQGYRTQAEQLTENRDSPEHSTHVREVFNSAAQIIARIEDTRTNAGEALDRRSDSVQEAAEAFSADAQMMDQRDEVAAFFRETAAALRAMATDQGRS